MRGVVVLLLVSQALAVPQAIYTGFDHIVVLDSQSAQATAYDYRRNLGKSTCDVIAQPPLVQNAALEDWLSVGAKASDSPNIGYLYLGYEIFMIHDRVTGGYILRRCRDFRPQLTALPCETFLTGTSPNLAAPNQPVFIGNNRIMIVNTETSEFTVHPFDADVHTGGDPFFFSSGPLLSGTFPAQVSIGTSFAYVQLDGHQGDLLVMRSLSEDRLRVFRFDGSARENLGITEVLKAPVAKYASVTSLGGNQVMTYTPDLSFRVHSFVVNNTNVASVPAHSGSLLDGHNCLYDNATACVLAEGCAWCGSSRTCHNYDDVHGAYCDSHACDGETVAADVQRVQVIDAPPDCEEDEDVDSNTVATADEESGPLPGNHRLDPAYRNSVGDFPHVDASPIHPALDNELGDEIDAETVDPAVVSENSKVSQGLAFVPPKPGMSAPCMNHEQPSNAPRESDTPALNSWRMNYDQALAPEVMTTSPKGDVALDAQARDSNCTRMLLRGGRPTGASVLEPTVPKYAPREGVLTGKDEAYKPNSVTTIREEDQMNYVKSAPALLNTNDFGPRPEFDNTKSHVKVSGEDLSYVPREGSASHQKPIRGPETPEGSIARLRLEHQGFHSADVMNAGIASVAHLAAADWTASGGEDSATTYAFHSAMQNSVKAAMPRTLEQQLDMFKSEPKAVVDYMPALMEDGSEMQQPKAPVQSLPRPGAHLRQRMREGSSVRMDDVIEEE